MLCVEEVQSSSQVKCESHDFRDCLILAKGKVRHIAHFNFCPSMY
jgi:hypothetical protein